VRTGTSENDTLYGISHGGNIDDILNGGAGDDRLYGYDGADTLNGGSGTNTLNGGDGNDIYKIVSKSGVDTIDDTDGIDTVLFNSAFNQADMTLVRDENDQDNLNILFNDKIEVVLKDYFRPDHLIEKLEFSDGSTISLLSIRYKEIGTSNNDSLTGHDGRDTLYGQNGNDTLYGYAGNDVFSGGSGGDRMYGGVGTDTYVFSGNFGGTNGYEDRIYEYAGEGNDRILFGSAISSTDVYSWTDGSSMYLQMKDNPENKISFSAVYDNDTNKYDYAEAIRYIQFNGDGVKYDLANGLNLTDTSESHSIYGGEQRDIIRGNGGNDYIYGNGGNDYIVGGAGGDRMSGGAGSDTYVLSGNFGGRDGYEDRITEYAGEGNDRILFGSAISSSDVYSWTDGSNMHLQMKDNPENKISFSAVYDNDTNKYDYAEAIRYIQFNGDNVKLDLTTGLKLNDTDDAHSIYGSEQRDIIRGNGGNDYIYGNGGNDVLYGDAGGDRLDGGEGLDRASYVYASTAVRAYLSDSSRNAGEAKDDTYTSIEDLQGSRHIDVLVGDSVNNRLWGYHGNDRIYGGNGNDYLDGQNGDDTLYGGSGNDRVLGSSGNDILYGQGGADAFIFQTDSIYNGSDKIMDFSQSQGDWVQFSTNILEGYDAVTDAISDFITITESSGHTNINVDRDGSGAVHSSQQVVRIEGVTGEWSSVDDMIAQGDLKIV